MRLTIYWTEVAENKLDDIFIYYEVNTSAKVAEKIVNGIINTTLKLEMNPHLGQVEETLVKRIQKFRYVVFKNYKIIYWVDEIKERLYISNVFDARQNPKKIQKTP